MVVSDQKMIYLYQFQELIIAVFRNLSFVSLYCTPQEPSIYKNTLSIIYFSVSLKFPVITSLFSIVLFPSTMPTFKYQQELVSILFVPDSYNKITHSLYYNVFPFFSSQRYQLLNPSGKVHLILLATEM